MAREATIRGERLPRPRVAALLADSLAAGHLLVVAEAGYGKTIALEQALERLGRPGAWVRCAPADREPGQLLYDVVDAVRTAVPGAVDVVGAALLDESPDLRVATLALLRELERLLVDPIVIVLDDAEHLAGSEGAAELIAILLGAKPGKVVTAILSRESPPVKLARLRAQGAVRVAGPEQLAFTAEECAALLELGLDGEPDPEQVEKAMAASEGWPLGLALNMFGPNSPGAGSRGELFAFLAEEVLDALEPHTRAQVLDSSLAQELNEEVCANLGLTQDFLGATEQRGLFLRAVDAEHRRFRYHPLVREFLLVRAAAERPPDARRAAHAAIARALAGAGSAEAIEHWLAAEAWDDALAAMAGAGDELARRAPELVRSWLECLPQAARDSHEAQFVQGRLEWAAGRVANAVKPLRAALKAFREAGDVAQEWATRSHLADCLWWLGEWDDIPALANGFDAAAAPDGAALRVALRAWEVERTRGSAARERDLLQRILAHPRADTVGHLVAVRLAEVDYQAGRITAARERLEAAARSVERPAIVWATLGSMLAELGDADGALASGALAVTAAGEDGDVRAIAETRVQMALVHAEAGNVNAAEAELNSLESLDETAMDYLATVVTAKVCAARGDHETAVELAERALRSLAPPSVDDEVTAALQLSPVFAAAEMYERGSMLVEGALAFVDRMLPGDHGRYYRARLLVRRAWLHWQLGDQSAAEASLVAALQEARDISGYVLHPEWSYVKQLVWQALERGAVEPVAVMRAVQRGAGDADTVMELCGHPLSEVRALAVAHAIGSGHPGALARLAEFDRDPHPSVATAARRGLERMREHPPSRSFVLLGGFAVERGPWPIPAPAWGRPIVTRLLRFLLIARDAPLPEDVLFEAFWPGKAPRAARHNLAVLVSHLRAVLDIPGDSESVVRISERTYRLTLAPNDRVDSEDFDRAASQALTADGSRRLALLEQARELWRGDPLPEDRYAEWTFAWRERLVERRLHVLSALTESYLARHDYNGAIQTARQALDADPLNEALQRSLMLAYARSGRRAHALRQYLVCRRALIDSIGVEPSRETGALQSRILAGEPV